MRTRKQKGMEMRKMRTGKTGMMWKMWRVEVRKAKAPRHMLQHLHLPIPCSFVYPCYRVKLSAWMCVIFIYEWGIVTGIVIDACMCVGWCTDAV